MALKPNSPQDLKRGLQRRKLITWLWRLPVIIATVAATWAFQKAYRIHFIKANPESDLNFLDLPEVVLGNVAEIAQLKLWQAKEFQLGPYQAILLAIPEAIPGGLRLGEQHFIAFDRRCTHLGCQIVLSDNPEAIAIAFNHRIDHPALVCYCHLSVFDVLQAGKAVSGPAQDALARIRLELRLNQLYATGIEAKEKL
ncbi:MAG: Rieske 2Fe-2S domain-containing protein [Deinococcales bacterium]